jgi:hypothetical protein
MVLVGYDPAARLVSRLGGKIRTIVFQDIENHETNQYARQVF